MPRDRKKRYLSDAAGEITALVQVETGLETGAHMHMNPKLAESRLRRWEARLSEEERRLEEMRVLAESACRCGDFFSAVRYEIIRVSTRVYPARTAAELAMRWCPFCKNVLEEAVRPSKPFPDDPEAAPVCCEAMDTAVMIGIIHLPSDLSGQCMALFCGKDDTYPFIFCPWSGDPMPVLGESRARFFAARG